MFTHVDMIQFVFDCFNKRGEGCFGEEDFLDLTKVVNSVTVNGGPKSWTLVLDKYDKVFIPH